jgi:dipeptidyl-peptidase-4
LLQQLNRKQNSSKLFYTNALRQERQMLSTQKPRRSVDIQANWESGNGWQWIENGEKFLWVTEKDGWRHIYCVTKTEDRFIKGDYDVMSSPLMKLQCIPGIAK